ncbi:MAG: biopolymer transporter ExbD [Longimicrobiales bacterium]|nr:biopolymer transporter ExbD [Longimicrobiales bacterium]
MRRSRGRKVADLPITTDINVTSLVDVAFVLLIIFIITAPIMQGGIEVDVPTADVQPLTARDSPFFVTVTRDGRVYIEETPTSVEEFERSFPQLAGNVEHVYLRADSLVEYGPVLKVIATLARSEKSWSLVGEPYGRALGPR